MAEVFRFNDGRRLDGFDKAFVISCGHPADLQHDVLKKALEDCGLKEVDLKTAVGLRNFRPAFIWAEMEGVSYNKSLYRLTSGVKNLIGTGKHVICRKNELYENLMKTVAASHVPTTIALTRKDGTFDPPSEPLLSGIYIVKPVEGSSGCGITVLQLDEERPSCSEIEDAVRNAQTLAKRLMPKVRSEVILSKYISDIRLWNGKKFHLRAFMLAVNYKGFRTYLFPNCPVYTARKPYVVGSLEDTDIHDTHLRSTEGDPSFPADAESVGISKEESDTIMSQIKAILKESSRILEPNAAPFEESRYCFEVFGADFLVDASNTVYILELNDKIGYQFNAKENLTKFSAEFFEWIRDFVIDPIFKSAAAPATEWLLHSSQSPESPLNNGEEDRSPETRRQAHEVIPQPIHAHVHRAISS